MSSVDDAFVNPTGNSRKRLKMSRGELTTDFTPKPSPLATFPTVAPASESAVAVAACRDDGACPHETALTAVHADLDAMRHLVTCQICHRLMYEPFSLSCGHSYCYSCLSQWLGGTRKGTCPDCRAVIYQQPTPSYIIRELALMFASRTHLLTDGETLEEHNTMAKEEAEIVAKDKSNTDSRTGGLFKGIFKGIFNRRGQLLPLHDPSDNVDRCPDCHWEIEDGYCNNCGQPVGDGFTDYDGDSVSDDDLDHDLSEHDRDIAFDGDIAALTDRVIEPHDDDDYDSEVDHDIFAAAFGFGGGGRHARRGLVPIQTRTITPDDEFEESDDYEHDYEHDSDMDGFIDDDEPHTEEESPADNYDSDRTEIQELAAPARPRRRNVISFSDDEQDEAGQAGPISVDDSDDDGPLAGATQRNVRSRNVPRQRAIALSSDEEDSGADVGHTINNRNENESDSNSENETENEIENGIENGTEDATENERDSEVEDDSDSVDDSDAESPPDFLPTGDHYDYFDNATEQTSSDRYGDDSDNGWDTRAALPLAMQEPRHHLGTGMQHRTRCARRQPTWPIPRAMPSDTLRLGPLGLFEVPLGTFEEPVSAPPRRIQPSYVPPTARVPPANRSVTQRSHLANVPSRVNQGRPRPAAPPIRSMTAPMGGPLPHPFNLADTLGRINDQAQQQPCHPASRRSLLAERSRSNSAGGVHLRSYSSESASDSSQTIGVSTNQNGKRTMEPVSGRLASHSNSRRV